MRVLMLDRNFLVDRRITLMAQSLDKAGHEIRLVHTRIPEEFSDLSESRRRLPKTPDPMLHLALAEDGEDYNLSSEGLGSAPPHIIESRKGGYRDGRMRMRIGNDFRRKLRKARFGKLGMMAGFYSRYPDIAVDHVKDIKWLGPLRHLVALPFKLLATPVYIRSALNKPKGIPSARIKGARPLDAWEETVVRYAYEHWRPDVVCANDAVTLRAGVEIKKLLGIPLVYDAHELYSYQPGIPHDEAKRLFMEEFNLMKHVDQLIVINSQQGAIMERDLDARNWIACTNATPWPDRFQITARYDWIRDETHIPEGHRIILFQGGINRERRIDYILRGLAAARRKDIHIVFLTFGSEIPFFREMAQDLGIGDRVHFLDLVPWDEMLFWAASADAGIMPYQATDQNTAISSPNKMYEFIMAGTPMIGSSDLVNVSRVVEGEGFGVLARFRNDADYTAAINEMFDERKGGPERFRPALIANARKYSWENESRAVMEMYAKLAERVAAGQTASGQAGQ
jgi:glycosyltransferase involved in cell wall biosynthesis